MSIYITNRSLIVKIALNIALGESESIFMLLPHRNFPKLLRWLPQPENGTEIYFSRLFGNFGLIYNATHTAC